ncbi:MAG: spermidine/putrescine ABC transporter ATP-binding protein, partial [Pseudomonadota bacterium]
MHDAMVSIRNVTKKFGSFSAVNDVTFDIRPNEFFALLGPSGC